MGGILMESPLKGIKEDDVIKPLSFEYKHGNPSDNEDGIRICEAKVTDVSGIVYAYATFLMGAENPLPRMNGGRQGLQQIILGQEVEGKFTPAVRFGMNDAGRAPEGQSDLAPWVFDGELDYYGMFARPNTPCDIKLKLDLTQNKMTVWVSGRGDDEWFMLVEDAPLMNPVKVINAVHVEQHPGAQGIHDVVIQSEQWVDGEVIRSHPLAKKNRVVQENKGFRFQSMRSVWRKPNRHITVARKPPVWMGFPDVVQTGPNTLVCTHNDGRAHGGGGGMFVRHSDDLGKTWSEAITVHPSGINCPRLQRFRDGRLLLLGDIHGGAVVFYDSTDGGKSWGNQRFLHGDQVGGNPAVVPSRITELPDGSWLLSGAWYPGGKPWVGTEGEKLEFFRSTDRGRTWEFLSSLQPYPPHSLSEASILVLPDGRLLLYAREARIDGLPGIKAYSKDNGKTWEVQELPFGVHGRTCAGFLKDGRVMLTFRSSIGRQALWAWVGDPEDSTTFRPAGVHFNDKHSVGLKDGALHIDNDGAQGQFTQYFLRPAESPNSAIDVTVEVKVVENNERAATLSIPFTGKLRLFPDRVEMAHDASLSVKMTPGKFHTYHVVSKGGKITLYIDGRLVLETDKLDSRIHRAAWSPAEISVYACAFGNERDEAWENHDGMEVAPDVWDANITTKVTGYSIWKRVEATVDNPQTGKHTISWSAERDGFPDQYQLDNIIEVEASVAGHDQGYSGWVELTDGRILVLAYTDDTAPPCPPSGGGRMGVSWIRGTYLYPSDLPPAIVD